MRIAVNALFLVPGQVGGTETYLRRLLAEANVVTTPGAGFGAAGEGYIRISAFNSRENVLEAADRLKKIL